MNFSLLKKLFILSIVLASCIEANTSINIFKEVSKSKPSYSYRGQISEKTGRPKNSDVRGHYRKDGTYVNRYYRS